MAWRLSAPARPTSNRVAPSMERAEKIGIGIATAGHVLLFGVLSANFLGTPNPLKLRTPPMDVQFVEKVGLEMAAPRISHEEMAPSEAPDIGPTEEAPPETAKVMPAPEPEPTPAPPPKKASPAPKPVEKAKPKPSPPKKAEPEKVKEKPKTEKRPRGSRLGSDFLKGIETERPTKRSEEHTSELQSLMRISYAFFCLK